jgi:hypothetical protein
VKNWWTTGIIRREIKKPAMEREEIFVINSSNERLVPRIYKELLQINKQKAVFLVVKFSCLWKHPTLTLWSFLRTTLFQSGVRLCWLTVCFTSLLVVWFTFLWLVLILTFCFIFFLLTSFLILFLIDKIVVLIYELLYYNLVHVYKNISNIQWQTIL